MTPRRFLALALLALACEPKDPYADPLQLLAPIATRDALVWTDVSRDELLFVQPADDNQLKIDRVTVGDERTAIAWVTATRDRTALLALTVPASAKEEDIEEQLHVFPGDGDGEPTTYDVQAPFSSVALTPDLRRAVLYFGGSGPAEQLHNANQIAIVDLGSDDLVNVTLNGFGGALQSVQFPGQQTPGQPAPVTIGGQQHDIAAFLAAGEVVLMDMDDPLLDQVAVPLGADIGFTPSRTLLRPGNSLFADPVLFILSSQGGEAGMLTLVPEAGGDGFTAQISLVSVGQSASDFALHDTDEIPYLITVDDLAGDLVFTDIRTQGGFRVPLGGPATRLHLRTSAEGRQVYAWASGGAEIATLELSGIDDSLGRKPDFLKIETGITDLVPLDNDRALVGSGNYLYIVDFKASQVTPLSSQSPYDPVAGSALVDAHLLLGTAGQTWVSTVDLQTLNPESMLLDDPIASFHYLPGPKRIVVTHPDITGHLTLVDPDKPSRATSRVHWGFLLQGALDR